MIAVVDYDTGNLRSVADALHRAGAEFILTADPALLRRADAALAASIFHYNEIPIPVLKRALNERNINVRV